MTYSLVGKTVEEPVKRIYLYQKYRREGLYIIGKSGSGKTTLIENLILQDIKQGLGICVLDPHGDLINDVISHMAAFVERLKDPKLDEDERKQAERMRQRLENDVILIDLEDRTYVPGLSLFHCENPQDAFEAKKTVDAGLYNRLWKWQNPRT